MDHAQDQGNASAEIQYIETIRNQFSVFAAQLETENIGLNLEHIYEKLDDLEPLAQDEETEPDTIRIKHRDIFQSLMNLKAELAAHVLQNDLIEDQTDLSSSFQNQESSQLTVESTNSRIDSFCAKTQAGNKPNYSHDDLFASLDDSIVTASNHLTHGSCNKMVDSGKQYAQHNENARGHLTNIVNGQTNEISKLNDTVDELKRRADETQSQVEATTERVDSMEQNVARSSALNIKNKITLDGLNREMGNPEPTSGRIQTVKGNGHNPLDASNDGIPEVQ